jgi:low temperature requirement protein LtrA
VFVALAVPGAFGSDALLFGLAYFAVRLMHVVLSAAFARGDSARTGALARFAPTAVVGSSLYVVAALVAPDMRMLVWAIALAIDYLGPALVGVGPRGWQIAVEHFAERQGLIVLIALGESILSIGVGAGDDRSAGTLGAVALGMVLASTFWWLYFGASADLGLRRLRLAMGPERARFARDAYSFLHLPMVAAIILYAFGVEATLHHVDEPLAAVPAVALCGGAALYLLANVVFIRAAARLLALERLIGAIAALALIPVAVTVAALPALALVAAVCVLVVGGEAMRASRAAKDPDEPGPAR